MTGFSKAFTARKRLLTRIVALAVVALAAGALCNSATAADVTWTGAGDMTWTQPDATSWNATYNAGDNVLFTSTGAGTVTISGTVDPANFSITSGTTYAFTGGTLSANGTSFQVGPTADSAITVTANMSGLSSFVYDNGSGTFRVGASITTNNTTTTTLTVAPSNTITANSLLVADQWGPNSASPGTATLRLGASNFINASTINVGNSGRSNGNLNFAGGSSSATFRGTDGSSPVSNWLVGNVNNTGTTRTFTDTVDLSNGTVDALVTTLSVGGANIESLTGRSGINNATFAMGAGNMTVSTLNVGSISNVGGGTVSGTLSANGTFTLNNAAGTLNAGTINLATNTITNSGGTRTVNGTFNLTDGTLKATTIQRGAQTGTATATTAFNWTNGTLQNTDGADLVISGAPITLLAGNHTFHATGTNSITVGPTANITGSGQGFTKTGTGRLVLTGTKTYTGPTTISAGTLQLGDGTTDGQLQNASAAIANQATLTFNTTGTQTFAGAVSGTGTIQKDGAGTLTLASTGSVAATQAIALNDGTMVVMSSAGGRTLANDIVLDGGTMAGGIGDNVGTGGAVSISGNLVTHTFTTSGNLTLPVAASTSQLIVGGGGGGGGGVNGVAYSYGGGGGQVRNLTGQNLDAGDTPVTVGAGGSGAGNADGGDGGSSSVGSNTAAGGQGAKVANARGGTSGSGNLGGTRNGTAAGGGGGNAAAGSNAPNTTTGAAGGAGTANTAISGLTGTYGGGGGGSAFTTGGAGGSGGGGAGSGVATGTPGTANTGGGGGGGQSGGSGIVVVQYDLVEDAGTLTLSGTIDVRSASTLDASRSDGLVIVSGTMTTTTGSGGLAIASSASAGGVVRYDAANTYLGNTTVQTGATLRQGIANALPSGTGRGNLVVSSGGTFDLNGFNGNINGLSGSGVVRATSGPATLTLGNADVDGLDFAGALQDSGGVLSLVKVGNGTQTLSGTNTYTGLTSVSAGTLALSGTGSIANSSEIVIGAGATLDITGLAGDFSLGAGQTLSGTGTLLATGKTIVADGTLSPGSSPGTAIQDGGVLQLAADANYNWQVYDASGVAGTGYDTTSLINGAELDLSLLTSVDPYNINLWSLSGIGPDVNGDATGFNNGSPYSWTLFSQDSAISGFSEDLFAINVGATNGTSGFSNSLGGGSFTVSLGGVNNNQSIMLNFIPVPEPSTLALLAAVGGLAGIAAARRRR